jgi:hypothetical protein
MATKTADEMFWDATQAEFKKLCEKDDANNASLTMRIRPSTLAHLEALKFLWGTRTLDRTVRRLIEEHKNARFKN